jgi:ATP-dependent Clp protease, protease subunit
MSAILKTGNDLSTHPDMLEALAAIRPKSASNFEDKLRDWLKANAEQRAFTAVKGSDGTLEMNMLDVIGEDWWTGGGITANRVKQQLDANKDAKSIKVLMNTPGGDAFEGLAIQSLLKRTGLQVDIEIIGLCASAGTVIAMAGNTIRIHEGGMFMIHEAWTFAMGSKRDMRQVADFLEKVDGSILDIYTRRTGRSANKVRTLVEAETWMTAHEAVAEKFATEVIAAKSGESSDEKSGKAKAMTQPNPETSPTPPAQAELPPPVAASAEPTAPVAGTPPAPAAPTPPVDAELSEDERAVTTEAASKALASHREQKDREYFENHPLARARKPAAPPLGGLRSR